MPKNIYAKKILQLLSGPTPKPVGFYYHYPTLKMFRKLTRAAYYGVVYQMEAHGHISFAEKNGRRFIKITRKGQLEMLMQKARLPRKQAWDGKWRLLIFDIPEKARDKRDQLRFILKSSGFHKLQASVFITPYLLSRDALAYLKKSGLIDYIRILRVDEMDDDRQLKKHFGL